MKNKKCRLVLSSVLVSRDWGVSCSESHNAAVPQYHRPHLLNLLNLHSSHPHLPCPAHHARLFNKLLLGQDSMILETNSRVGNRDKLFIMLSVHNMIWALGLCLSSALSVCLAALVSWPMRGFPKKWCYFDWCRLNVLWVTSASTSTS